MPQTLWIKVTIHSSRGAQRQPIGRFGNGALHTFIKRWLQLENAFMIIGGVPNQVKMRALVGVYSPVSDAERRFILLKHSPTAHNSTKG